MKGYGLTVVEGPGRRAVRRRGPRRRPATSPSTARSSSSRLSGLDLAETGVVAGMSGSPVYLDGKLAGAVASGWGFSKRADRRRDADRGDEVDRPGERAAGGAPSLHRASDRRAGGFPRAPRGEPGGGPDRAAPPRAGREPPAGARTSSGGVRLLSFQGAGLPASTVEAFRGPLSRLGVSEANLALLGASAQAPPGPVPPDAAAALTPGASVAAYLVRGDLRLGATGTVTEVYPDGRFVAFGHPFLAAGELELPVATRRGRDRRPEPLPVVQARQRRRAALPAHARPGRRRRRPHRPARRRRFPSRSWWKPTEGLRASSISRWRATRSSCPSSRASSRTPP